MAVKLVSKRAGHANITTTLQIYGHLLEDEDTEAAAVTERLIRDELG